MIGIEPYASREEFSKVSVRFDSGGVDCAAWLYRPDRPRSAPLVVMGPGLAAERTFGYPALAEGLAERGVATLLFDYRRFGDSEGTPRGVVSIQNQLADWMAAIERAVTLDGVDTDNLALWGHSLGGGHALRIATEDHRVDAVIGHSPIVDGRAVLRSNGYTWLGNALLAGVRDRVGGLVGRNHHVPVVPCQWYAPNDTLTDSDDFDDASDLDDGWSADGDATDGQSLAAEATQSGGQRALLPHRAAAEAFSDLVPLRSDWENRIRARIVLDLWGYNPGAVAGDVDVPVLLVTGSDDPIVPAASVARTSRRLSDGSFLALPTDHFSLLEDPWRRRLLGHAGAFLADALGE